MSEEQHIPQDGPNPQTPGNKPKANPPLSEATGADQLTTTNLQQENQDMEVHKHPHHVTHKKNWTEYILEFFMLFLAVFLGFIAENIREGVVEKHREKQFIESLINDLRLDTVALNTVTESANARIQNIDSAILSLEVADNEIPFGVYEHLKKSTDQVMFFPNDGTITQLKSSGGMRLIKNRKAVDYIENYDRLMRRLEVRRGITNELVNDFTRALNKTMIGADLLRASYDSLIYKKKTVERKDVRIDHQNLNELINSCISVRLRAQSDTTTNSFIKRKASELIDFLKNDYRLKNE